MNDVIDKAVVEAVFRYKRQYILELGEKLNQVDRLLRDWGDDRYDALRPFGESIETLAQTLAEGKVRDSLVKGLMNE